MGGSGMGGHASLAFRAARRPGSKYFSTSSAGTACFNSSGWWSNRRDEGVEIGLSEARWRPGSSGRVSRTSRGGGNWLDLKRSRLRFLETLPLQLSFRRIPEPILTVNEENPSR